MRRAIRYLAVALLVAACSSAAQNSGPAVEIHAAPIGLSSDILYFPGPLNLQFQISVANPTTQALTMRSLRLETSGAGAFVMRSGDVNVNRTIPAGSTATFTVSAWGRALGGYMNSETPVSLHGTAYFADAQNKSFIRMFNEILTAR